ncbi:nitric oxide reductase F protein [Aliiruegeria sabulilitoris]|uniref:nitric oxide reductase F protein n=1 Tax=Aliiruegeria sabulilitoris TaxID=1510458 RepID=UPI0012E34536|nr:nitric oxide reductase F protein [Aliiruegeria sabulilitoris]NDR58148.1 nitric oxide reductase F protein [Pseudoruegeria sp. M32A2M]
MKSLTRAWFALILLSGASAANAVMVSRNAVPTIAGVAILLVAWMKTRVILSRYLGLWQAPSWRAGFNGVLGVYCLFLLGLYVVPVLAS